MHLASPRPLAGRALAALLLALAASPMWLVPAPLAAAADELEMQARALAAGRFAPGGWAALEVAIHNPGAPVAGYVVAEVSGGEVRRFVELAGGARKLVDLYVRAEGFTRQVAISFVTLDGGGLGSTMAELRSVNAGESHVAVVGEASGVLRDQMAGEGAVLEPSDVTPLGVGDLPARPEPLAAFTVIVWAADATQLDGGRRRALERWVADGGHLVVLGGPDWQARTTGLEALLPIEELRAADDVSLASLAEWTGAEAPGESVTAASGTPRPNAMALLPFGDDEGELAGLPLLAAGTLGSGHVTWVAADLGAGELAEWAGAAAVWRRAVPLTPDVERFFGGPVIEEDRDNMVVQALGAIPALEVPPAELLLVVIVGYILLIGPLNYIVLRRLDRRDLAWVTAPVLVVVFSAGSYGIGTALKGSELILNEVSIVRASESGTAASVRTYAGLFSPSRATYDVTVGGDALLTALGSGIQFDAQGRPVRPDVGVEQGDPAHLRGVEVNVFGLQALRADAVVEYQSSLRVEWRYSENGITGTVENAGSEPLSDVAVVNATSGDMVGDLEPGERGEFSLRTDRFDGNPPSTQVYGFDNFSGDSDLDERLRRQVLDALTGFNQGGFAGPMGVVAASDPMVIGWRSGRGPIPIEVDGRTVAHQGQIAEIVTGRPAFGDGEVTLYPTQLTTSVVSTDGAASRIEGGAVSIGHGEAELRIALPMEAAGLDPSEVRIVVGSDPWAVYVDPLNAQAFFQPGYSLAAFDHEAGEWEDLGEVGQIGRFTLDDPDRFLDQGGEMLIRLTGSEQVFGEMPAYVSAIVEGRVP